MFKSQILIKKWYTIRILEHADYESDIRPDYYKMNTYFTHDCILIAMALYISGQICLLRQKFIEMTHNKSTPNYFTLSSFWCVVIFFPTIAGWKNDQHREGSFNGGRCRSCVTCCCRSHTRDSMTP